MMRSSKSIPLLAQGVGLALLLVVSGCQLPERPSDEGRYSLELQTAQVEPKRVEGGNFPAVEPDPEAPLNEAEEDKPYWVPTGPQRGEMRPNNPEYEPRELEPEDPTGSGDSQAPLFFEEYDEIDDAPSVHVNVPEPGHDHGQLLGVAFRRRRPNLY
jgi:hypothetical protein